MADESAPATPGFLGVAAYVVRPDGVLDGVWTTPNLHGATGTEVASPLGDEGVAGRYDVVIRNPAGATIFDGTLSIEADGDIFSMTWDGEVPATGAAQRFVGLGLLRDGVLSATWRPDTSVS